MGPLSRQHTVPTTEKKQSALLSVFNELYPEPRSELMFENEYQLTCAVLLSAQCTDKKVNDVTPELFGRFPDFVALSRASLATVQQIIRPINYYRTKAHHLIAMATLVCGRFNGSLPRTIEELRLLPGVGQKTASVIISERGFGHALPVDTHVFRVSRRLGLAVGENVKKVEAELMERFPSTQWRNLHHWLILHGRRICKAQRPLCEECGVAKLCPSAFKVGSTSKQSNSTTAEARSRRKR